MQGVAECREEGRGANRGRVSCLFWGLNRSPWLLFPQCVLDSAGTWVSRAVGNQRLHYEKV